MTLKQAISHIFDWRIKEGDMGWDEAQRELSKMGQWSLSASPRKFEQIIMELCKRVERLEENYAERQTERIEALQSNDQGLPVRDPERPGRGVPDDAPVADDLNSPV